MTECERFEAWAKENGYDTARGYKGDHYHAAIVREMWRAWQAARQHDEGIALADILEGERQLAAGFGIDVTDKRPTREEVAKAIFDARLRDEGITVAEGVIHSDVAYMGGCYIDTGSEQIALVNGFADRQIDIGELDGHRVKVVVVDLDGGGR